MPFGVVVSGMNVAEALNGEYGEAAGSGIRSSHQGPFYQIGSTYLERNFPRLDYIRLVTIAKTDPNEK